MSEKQKNIIIGSDHGGFELKEFLKAELSKKGITVEDVGTYSPDSVDYPHYGSKVAQAVASGAYERGIVICGTGIGISIAANRFKGVRAAVCCNVEMARLSREHNNANILALGGRTTDKPTAAAILETWLSTPFAGGRHEKRVNQLDTLA